MKKVLLTLSLVCLLVACKDSSNDRSEMDTKAQSLGYSSVDEYVKAVARECQNDRHENCEILTDSTHTACLNPVHSGVNCNGEHRQGGNHNGEGNHGNQNGGQGNGHRRGNR